jgi:ubiquinone biosynthesis protein
LFNIEGLGRELYPQLDLWKTAHPVMKKWMSEQVGPEAMLNDLRELMPQLREVLKDLPAAIRYLASKAK